jgi:heptose-I-phosphate ethanolaminephosphotransferase
VFVIACAAIYFAFPIHEVWGPLDWIELAVLMVGAIFSPWALATLRHTQKDRKMQVGMVILVILLVLPKACGLPVQPRHLVATIVLLTLGQPFLRAHWWLRRPAFVVLAVGLMSFLLPLMVFLLERCPPSEEIWAAMIQSNPGEAREYLLCHNWLTALLPLLGGCLALALCSKATSQGHPSGRWMILLIGLLAVNLATGAPMAAYQANTTFKSLFRNRNDLAQARNRGISSCVFTAQSTTKSRKILLVIGESTARNHMSLYGYPVPTTPHLHELKNAGNLFVFSDVISPHCLTMPSLQEVLTTSNNERPIPFVKAISIQDVFSRAGFETWWISNQGRVGLFDNQVSILAAASNHVLYTSCWMGSSLNAAPDEVLFPGLDHLLPHKPGNDLVICHLMGCHVDYTKRVPDHYRKKLIESGLVPDDYDVAIHYGDSVLAGIIQRAEKAGFDMVIYLSDHGEEPRNQCGHNPARYVSEMVEIPFLIWVSPEFRRGNPRMVQNLLEAQHKPYMTDDLIHTLLDLAGIQGSLFDPTRSLVNEAFMPRPRRVIQNAIAYVPSQKSANIIEPQSHSLGQGRR